MASRELHREPKDYLAEALEAMEDDSSLFDNLVSPVQIHSGEDLPPNDWYETKERLREWQEEADYVSSPRNHLSTHCPALEIHDAVSFPVFASEFSSAVPSAVVASEIPSALPSPVSLAARFSHTTLPSRGIGPAVPNQCLERNTKKRGLFVQSNLKALYSLRAPIVLRLTLPVLAKTASWISRDEGISAASRTV